MAETYMERRNAFLIPVVRSQILRLEKVLHRANLANPGQLHDILAYGDRALGCIGPHGLQLDIVRGRWGGLAVHGRVCHRRGTAPRIGRRRGRHVRGVCMCVRGTVSCQSSR